MDKMNEYKRLGRPKKKAEILTTETIMESKPEPVEVKSSSQSCGRCKSYRFDKIKGILICEVRGGRRKETDGGDCKKFEVKDG